MNELLSIESIIGLLSLERTFARVWVIEVECGEFFGIIQQCKSVASISSKKQQKNFPLVFFSMAVSVFLAAHRIAMFISFLLTIPSPTALTCMSWN